MQLLIKIIVMILNVTDRSFSEFYLLEKHSVDEIVDCILRVFLVHELYLIFVHFLVYCITS